MTGARQVLAARMTEQELQTAVIEMARLFGWQVAHFRPARTLKGWVTPVEGDAGYPDLTLAKDGTVLFVELKSQDGDLTAAQQRWRDAIDPAEWRALRTYQRTSHWRCWRPYDLSSGVIERTLRGGEGL